MSFACHGKPKWFRYTVTIRVTKPEPRIERVSNIFAINEDMAGFLAFRKVVGALAMEVLSVQEA